MTFDEILAQVIELLQRQGRVSYRALKRRYDLDDEYIEDLKEEILYVHESDVQADERATVLNVKGSSIIFLPCSLIFDHGIENG